MGNKQSSGTGCNYSTYNLRILKLNEQYTSEKIKTGMLEKQLKEKISELEKKDGEIEKIRDICLVNKSESVEQAGKKIYNILKDRDRENINFLNTQQTLIDKQNKLLGDKETMFNSQDEKIKKLDEDIVKNDRIIQLNKEDEYDSGKKILFLKIICVIIVIFLSALIYKNSE